MLVRRLEIVRHALPEIVIAVVVLHAAGLFGMGVDIDRHESTPRRERYARRLQGIASGCSFAVLWWKSGE
jgi:hypothetical protein